MSDAPPREALVALDFLPPGIGQKPLYEFLGPLIDYALLPSEGANETPVDPLVRPLLLDYRDPEAVNAYLNLFVRPILGTRKAIDYAFQLLDIHPDVLEWWEPRPAIIPTQVPSTRPSDRAFHFTVTFEEGKLPRGAFDFHALIRMILALKNERSKLVWLRMSDCVEFMVLDEDCILDLYYLDSLEGYVDPLTGVVICLHDEYQQSVRAGVTRTFDLRTSRTVAVTRGFASALLDFTTLDLDTDLDQGGIAITQSSTWVHLLNPRYHPRDLDPDTGLLRRPQGRTTLWTGFAGGEAFEPAPRSGHTAAFVEEVPTGLSPSPYQTVPFRVETQRVAPERFYPQHAWSDHPYAPGASTVTFYLSGESYLGGPVAELRIGGLLVDTVTVTARHGVSSQAFSYTGRYGPGVTTLSATFTNDAYGGTADTDRNLYIDAVAVDGARTEVNVAQLGPGAWTGSFVVGFRPRTWDEPGLTWVGAQPQAAGRRVSEILPGWSLGDAAATLGRPGSAAVLFYGVRGGTGISMASPVLAAAGKAPPTGAAGIVLGRPDVLAEASVGVTALGASPLTRVAARGRGQLVPKGAGILPLDMPRAGGAGAAPIPDADPA